MASPASLGRQCGGQGAGQAQRAEGHPGSGWRWVVMALTLQTGPPAAPPLFQSAVRPAASRASFSLWVCCDLINLSQGGQESKLPPGLVFKPPRAFSLAEHKAIPPEVLVFLIFLILFLKSYQRPLSRGEKVGDIFPLRHLQRAGPKACEGDRDLPGWKGWVGMQGFACDFQQHNEPLEIPSSLQLLCFWRLVIFTCSSGDHNLLSKPRYLLK